MIDRIKEIEKEMREFFVTNNISHKLGKDGERYHLLDGPPTPNGPPHMGHARGHYVIKDFYIKKRAMEGRKIFIKPGYDTHGLPVEIKVEAKFGFKNKRDIEEKMGTKKFIEECKKFATLNMGIWEQLYKYSAHSYYNHEPYLTYSLNYMNSVWWAFKELYNKGLIYEGEKPVYWCSRCGTAMSGYEVSMEYREMDDPSLYIKFPIEGKENEYLLVWTTTPWTLPSNVAIAVHPEEIYVKVSNGKEILILAKKRYEALKDMFEGYKVIEELEGRKLEGIKYKPIIDVEVQRKLNGSEKARKVYLSIEILKKKAAGKVATKREVSEEELESCYGHLVTMDEGTGLVHIAPGHGNEDYQLGLHYNLPALSPVDDEGRFTEEVELWKGIPVREANEKIVEYLEKKGLVFKVGKIKHRYPVCWRCSTPLIFRLSKQIFLNISKIKKDLLRILKEVNWKPEFVYERIKNWTENSTDWTLSRQRYWNIPIPIWKCKKCGKIKVIGSSYELEELTGKEINDIHRDVVDEIVLKCDCGGEMKRIKDVFDVWFESACASFAQIGYPYKNKELFKQIFPADRVDEGQDQIRGWFFYSLVVSTALFNKPYSKTISMHGWVLDEIGRKMSKSLGNVITGEEAFTTLGSDIAKFYLLWESAPWDSLRFSMERAKKEVGGMLNILINILRFVIETSDNFKEGKEEIEDKWIISRLNSVVRLFNKYSEDYKLNLATREVFKFILNDLSKEYMKLAKERIKRGDKVAFDTLLNCLLTVAKLLAPITYFTSEYIYQKLKEKGFVNKLTILHENYPKAIEEKINKKIEEDYEKVREIIEAILRYREMIRRNVRWPIKAISIEGFKLNEWERIVKERCNIKEVTNEKYEDVIEAGNVKIYVNKELDEQLIKEGFTREVIRKVQELRKKLRLKPKDEIELYITGINNNEIIEKAIIEKVNCEKINYEKPSSYDISKKEKIKDKEIEIFVKVKE